MRFRSGLLAAAIVPVLGLAALPAGASDDLISGEDVGRILNLARGYGSATATTDSGGDPMIEGRIDGILYVLHFYGCTGGKACREIQFRASWEPTGSLKVADMNEWNRTRRFGKAYLDSDGGPVIEMLINLHAGVSTRNLDDSFDWWRIVVREFRDEVVSR